jgi:hypothetical protein
MTPESGDRFASASEALRSLEKETDSSGVRGNGSPNRKFTGIVAVSVLAALVVVLVAALVFYPSAQNGGEEKVSDSLQVPRDQTYFEQDPAAGAGEAQADSLSTGLHGKRTEDSMPSSPASSVKEDIAHKPASSTTEKQNDSGYIQISCAPWAKVFLGNEYIGTTPIAGTLKVQTGSHTLTFENPSFLPIVKTVSVERNTHATVEVNFLESIGYIFVSVTPWAEIFIDDQSRETTPLSQPLMVSAGPRKLRLHNPSYEDIVETITVQPKDTIRVVRSFLDREKR